MRFIATSIIAVFYLLIIDGVFAQPDKTSTSKGLVIHCPFDSSIKDNSPNNYPVTNYGSKLISKDCPVGSGCISFDGKDDYLKFNSKAVYFEGDYSISIWCNWEKRKPWMRILDFNQSIPTSGNAVTFLIGRTDKHSKHALWFDQWVTNSTNIVVESIVNFERNKPSDASLLYIAKKATWDHYVITFSSEGKNILGSQINTKNQEVPLTGVVTLYVNGKKASTNYYCLSPQDKTTSHNFLGKSLYSTDPFYNGKMDDFRIYDRIITEEEISTLYSLKTQSF